MKSVTDDTGYTFRLPDTPRRIVSLVPSITEAIAHDLPSALVGATDWCTHPADLNVPRVRGTKNPDLAKIASLKPDLVLTNKEENRRLDVERLRTKGIAVWVSVIETVPESIAALHRIYTAALGESDPDWLTQAATLWNAAPPVGGTRAVIPIWRDPWMAVGSSTFTGDMAERVGLTNVFGSHPERYPHVSVDEILAAEPELLVFPDEPYAFSASDGPEAFPAMPYVLVEGRLLTWYGPSLIEAHQVLHTLFGRRS